MQHPATAIGSDGGDLGLRRERAPPPRVRHLRPRPRPLRARARRTAARGGGPQDEQRHRAADRPAGPRPAPRGLLRGHRGLRPGAHSRSRHVRAAAPVRRGRGLRPGQRRCWWSTAASTPERVPAACSTGPGAASAARPDGSVGGSLVRGRCARTARMRLDGAVGSSAAAETAAPSQRQLYGSGSSGRWNCGYSTPSCSR